MQPPYPRVPHLAPGPGVTRDDLVLSTDARDRLLNGRVCIEEKLDGANLSFAVHAGGLLEVASRGGLGTVNRGGHLGRARAWGAERSDGLRSLLADGCILYGEWLLTRHGVGYDSLPDQFVGFDLLDPKAGWVSIHDRDERLHLAGLATPPTLGEFDGVDLAAVDALMGSSAFGASCIEGVIVRAIGTSDGVPRLAKRLAVGVPRVTDEAFGRSREENRTAPAVQRA
jgi:atypical dual specificity phosphatase